MHYQNVDYLDCLGAVLAETGAQEEAVQTLQKAVALQPDRGFAKYMCAHAPSCTPAPLFSPLASCKQATMARDPPHKWTAPLWVHDRPLSFPNQRQWEGMSMHRYLGQLLEDEEALAALRQGITVLQTAIDAQARFQTHCCCA